MFFNYKNTLNKKIFLRGYCIKIGIWFFKDYRPPTCPNKGVKKNFVKYLKLGIVCPGLVPYIFFLF